MSGQLYLIYNFQRRLSILRDIPVAICSDYTVELTIYSLKLASQVKFTFQKAILPYRVGAAEIIGRNCQSDLIDLMWRIIWR
ncbi:MAG: hypothetical protein CMQ17_07235 [Gammaproteobacteria bacterium]|nr:hypothetical protein [Gammaproteobacteria bacterium]